ncbi:uncharacterized protein MYCFIDRAFT_176138 [Pseudocercospora fijiensis CIRAD86]|uniref:Uncharacterized protein n=1 Tax=Pseudocercospora fijiensis (strain CIRAD86) TaxID=383855 RepID=M2YST7_PSEFD|nr:uncharacterized protein MYCFIDRAFT_176138 [Pseudocercospora fijiensis CIRAD86]EME80755.1 hypothetical protein MYCFIDRAFT_176138 [Pseudocercospora fijiensis CIRAD86]
MAEGAFYLFFRIQNGTCLRCDSLLRDGNNQDARPTSPHSYNCRSHANAGRTRIQG